MKFNKKLMIDLLILIVPMIIIFLLMSILPDKVVIQRSSRSYIDKRYLYPSGIAPFIIYKLGNGKK